MTLSTIAPNTKSNNSLRSVTDISSIEFTQIDNHHITCCGHTLTLSDLLKTINAQTATSSVHILCDRLIIDTDAELAIPAIVITVREIVCHNNPDHTLQLLGQQNARCLWTIMAETISPLLQIQYRILGADDSESEEQSIALTIEQPHMGIRVRLRRGKHDIQPLTQPLDTLLEAQQPLPRLFNALYIHAAKHFTHPEQTTICAQQLAWILRWVAASSEQYALRNDTFTLLGLVKSWQSDTPVVPRLNLHVYEMVFEAQINAAKAFEAQLHRFNDHTLNSEDRIGAAELMLQQLQRQRQEDQRRWDVIRGRTKAAERDWQEAEVSLRKAKSELSLMLSMLEAEANKHIVDKVMELMVTTGISIVSAGVTFAVTIVTGGAAAPLSIGKAGEFANVAKDAVTAGEAAKEIAKASQEMVKAAKRITLLKAGLLSIISLVKSAKQLASIINSIQGLAPGI